MQSPKSIGTENETVQAELHGEQRERRGRRLESRWLPHQPGRNGHHDVEGGPHRTEDPVRWIP